MQVLKSIYFLLNNFNAILSVSAEITKVNYELATNNSKYIYIDHYYFTTTHHKVDQANKYLQPIVILWYISDNFPMSCCWFNGEHMSYISKYQCIELAHCNNRGSQIKPHKYPIQVVNLPMIMMCNKLALCVHASCLFNIEQYFKRLSCLHIN